MTNRVTLFRPVGPTELDLIKASGWRRFPPRRPEQPIFYPVVQREYAEKIARDWNVKESGAGYVTRFDVDADYLARYDVHPAGGMSHLEYWIPAEELDSFNDHILGPIEVVATFPPPSNDWVQVYDLAQDQETIGLVQRATLRTKDFGVVPEVALFGSKEWWAAVEDGRIPTHRVSGTISRVFASGSGDWPEFEVDSDGLKTSWTRAGDQRLYQEGRAVRLEYVLQKSRKAGVGELRNVLRIFIRAGPP